MPMSDSGTTLLESATSVKPSSTHESTEMHTKRLLHQIFDYSTQNVEGNLESIIEELRSLLQGVRQSCEECTLERSKSALLPHSERYRTAAVVSSSSLVEKESSNRNFTSSVLPELLQALLYTRICGHSDVIALSDFLMDAVDFCMFTLRSQLLETLPALSLLLTNPIRRRNLNGGKTDGIKSFYDLHGCSKSVIIDDNFISYQLTDTLYVELQALRLMGRRVEISTQHIDPQRLKERDQGLLRGVLIRFDASHGEYLFKSDDGAIFYVPVKSSFRPPVKIRVLPSPYVIPVLAGEPLSLSWDTTPEKGAAEVLGREVLSRRSGSEGMGEIWTSAAHHHSPPEKTNGGLRRADSEYCTFQPLSPPTATEQDLIEEEELPMFAWADLEYSACDVGKILELYWEKYRVWYRARIIACERVYEEYYESRFDRVVRGPVVQHTLKYDIDGQTKSYNLKLRGKWRLVRLLLPADRQSLWLRHFAARVKQQTATLQSMGDHDHSHPPTGNRIENKAYEVKEVVEEREKNAGSEKKAKERIEDEGERSKGAASGYSDVFAAAPKSDSPDASSISHFLLNNINRFGQQGGFERLVEAIAPRAPLPSSITKRELEGEARGRHHDRQQASSEDRGQHDSFVIISTTFELLCRWSKHILRRPNRRTAFSAIMAPLSALCRAMLNMSADQIATNYKALQQHFVIDLQAILMEVLERFGTLHLRQNEDGVVENSLVTAAAAASGSSAGKGAGSTIRDRCTLMVFEITERIQLALSLKLFQSSQIRVQLKGLRQVIHALHGATRNTEFLRRTQKKQRARGIRSEEAQRKLYLKSAYVQRLMDDGDSFIWLTVHHFTQWILDKKLVRHLLGTRLHIELVRHSEDIFVFLAKDGVLTTQHLLLLWVAARNSHEDTSKLLLDLVLVLTQYFDERHINVLYHQLESLLLDEYDDTVLQFIEQFTMQHLQASENDDVGEENDQKEGMNRVTATATTTEAEADDAFDDDGDNNDSNDYEEKDIECDWCAEFVNFFLPVGLSPNEINEIDSSPARNLICQNNDTCGQRYGQDRAPIAGLDLFWWFMRHSAAKSCTPGSVSGRAVAMPILSSPKIHDGGTMLELSRSRSANAAVVDIVADAAMCFVRLVSLRGFGMVRHIYIERCLSDLRLHERDQIRMTGIRGCDGEAEQGGERRSGVSALFSTRTMSQVEPLYEKEAGL